MNKLPLRNW